MERNPHARLWRLLAEQGLEELDLSIAERAFVKCENYYGLQLVLHPPQTCVLQNFILYSIVITYYVK